MTRRTRVDHYHHRGGGCLWLFLAAILLGLFDTYPVEAGMVLAVAAVAAIVVALYTRR